MLYFSALLQIKHSPCNMPWLLSFLGAHPHGCCAGMSLLSLLPSLPPPPPPHPVGRGEALRQWLVVDAWVKGTNGTYLEQGVVQPLHSYPAPLQLEETAPSSWLSTPCSSCLCWWSLRTWLPCSHLPALNSQRRTCWMASQHFLTLWKAQKPITVCQGALNLRSYPGSLLAPAHPRAPPLTPSSYETGAAGPGSPAGA